MFEKIKKNNLVLLGFKKINNQSYGIIVKNNKGIDKIVEFKEASKKERKINVCNSGMMAFDNKALKLIKNIKNKSKSSI